jgi:hypothetical protein
MSYSCFSRHILMNLEFFNTFSKNTQISKGRDSAVGTATRYGLDGPGIFRTRLDRPWGPPGLLYNGYWIFPGVKRPGHGVYHPPAYSADVKERVQLYLYSISGPSWPVIGWTVPIPLLKYQISAKSVHWEPSCCMAGGGGRWGTYIHTRTDGQRASQTWRS